MKLEKVRQTWEALLAEKQKETQTKYQSLMEIIDDESVPTSVKEVKTQEIENLQKQYQEMQKNRFRCNAKRARVSSYAIVCTCQRNHSSCSQSKWLCICDG